MKTKELKLHKNLPSFIYKIKNILSDKQIPARYVLFFIEFFSTIWFLIRVIPKPSRAAYPCMQAAYPFLSGFVIYILSVTTAVFAFKKSKQSFIKAKYLSAGLFFIIALLAGVVNLDSSSIPVYANSKLLISPNQPIGVARGIYPGRVVWTWNPDATNENCTNSFGDGWFMNNNTNMYVVNTMFSNSIIQLTEENSVYNAWNELFKYFNIAHGKGNIGYTPGEKIFIKTNQVSASSGTYNPSTFEILNQQRYGMAETSPQIVRALLRQLVNEYGVLHEDIAVGEPMKHMYKHVFDMWHNEFPNVTYIDSDARLGRTAPIQSNEPSIYYSDRGTILKTNGTTGEPVTSDYFPAVITETDYVIAVSALKAHARGGITLSAKVHFGSNLRSSAKHLHGGLVDPNKENNDPMRTGYGIYRVQVDNMGSQYLGGNTVLFIVDGLWGGSEANDPPRKFQMQPFNSDWSSSIFVSQDQVALESVCFDFLKAEYTADRIPFYGDYPQMFGCDDCINQAADSSYWPQGFVYDPENDGSPIGSLGVCEHWNDPINMLYTRNLNTGDGIELLKIRSNPTFIDDNNSTEPSGFVLMQNFPNPFNPSTKIRYSIPSLSGVESNFYINVQLIVYDFLGNEITTLVDKAQPEGSYEIEFNASGLSSGVYLCKLKAGDFNQTNKLVSVK
jgi:hypothetical protein